MARRRSKASDGKKSTAKASVTETSDAVVVTWEGYQLPPPVPPRQRPRHCGRCGWGPASTTLKSEGGDRYATTETGYFFECRRCVDADTGRPYRWKEPR